MVDIYKSPAHDELETLFEKEEWDPLDEDLNGIGLFVGNRTLEIDLVDAGYKDELLSTLKELGGGKRSKKYFKRP